MKKLFIVIGLLLTGFAGWAQHPGLQLLCRPVPDSIMLRWAPIDKTTWDLGNQYGYMVERHTLLRGGKLLPAPERRLLTATPQKPAPLQQWEPYAENDKFVAAAAQCIFDEGVSMPMASPVAVAKRYEQEQNRFSLALYAADRSVTAARLSGLYLTDKTALPDEKYLYTVYIPLPDSVATADTAFAFTGLSEYQPLPRPLELSARWENKKVFLTWNIFYLNHIYNTYSVEKSTDGRHYAPVSENAMVQLADPGISPMYAYRSDSLPDNETIWYYRVRGYNAFGEPGPPSDSVMGHGSLPITQSPVITGKEVINNKTVKLEWTYPEDMNRYITGFRVYRSAKPTGVKQRIYESKNPPERNYTDLSPELTNYYTMSVFDDETEKFTSNITYAELVDSIPPAPPTGLTGRIDSTGRVWLNWSPNADKDIEGYRIYRGNHPDFDFLLITPTAIRQTAYMDSINLNTLTKYIYYRLRAIDLRQNQSDYSTILELQRPDTIPPVAPVIKSIEGQKGALLLTWINSTSSDVVRHHISRKQPADSVFRLIAAIDKPSAPTSTYTDKTVAPDETYIYRIVAEDENGLLSTPSTPVQQRAPGAPPERIRLKQRQQSEQTILSWDIQSTKKIARVVIYKATGEAPLQLYDYSTESAFTDAQTPEGTTCRYKIKAIYDDGSASALSNEVTVKM
jgi:fibronectin type 3 domain-containing protein